MENNSVLENLYLPFPFENYTIYDLIGVNATVGNNTYGENTALMEATRIKHGLLMYIKFLLMSGKDLCDEFDYWDIEALYEYCCSTIKIIEEYLNEYLKGVPYKVIDYRPMMNLLELDMSEYDKYRAYLNNIISVYLSHITEYPYLTTVEKVSGEILNEYKSKNISLPESLKECFDKYPVIKDYNMEGVTHRLSITPGKYR